MGPGQMAAISFTTSMKSRPDFLISDGLVVTPSSNPVSCSSLMSAISAVSAKNFMWIRSLRLGGNLLPSSRCAQTGHPIRWRKEYAMDAHVLTERKDGVLSITLARPERRNAITVAMYAGLAD